MKKNKKNYWSERFHFSLALVINIQYFNFLLKFKLFPVQLINAVVKTLYICMIPNTLIFL